MKKHKPTGEVFDVRTAAEFDTQPTGRKVSFAL